MIVVIVPFCDSPTSSCAHNMEIRYWDYWIWQWSHDPHNNKSCPAVLLLYKKNKINGLTPVDPAGPDCYQNRTKPQLFSLIFSFVRMESIAASYLIASLEKDKQYHNFLKLSPFKVDDIEIKDCYFLMQTMSSVMNVTLRLFIQKSNLLMEKV